VASTTLTGPNGENAFATVIREVETAGDDFIRFSDIPDIVIPSSVVTIEYTSSQEEYTARGFVIGWNLDADDVTTNSDGVLTNRVLTVDECTPPFCTKVSQLTEDEQKNYSNWFNYYRNKNLVMKGGLSQAIMGTTQGDESQPFSGRAGLAILNDDNRFRARDIDDPNRIKVGKIISDIDSLEARYDLLDEIYRIPAGGSTPLRSTLVRAGEYFSTNGDPDAVQELFGQVANHADSETASPTSPILPVADGGSCQKNYAVLFTDGQWTAAAGKRDEFFTFANEDSDGPGIWDDHPSFRGGPASGLADVAMYYFENDLAPNVPDQVLNTDRRFDGRPIPHQHMITTGITFGVEGDLDFSNERDDFPYNPFAEGFNWGTDETDDLAHAAWNSRGSFYSTSDPSELSRAFNEILDVGSQTQVTTAAASLNTSRVDTNGGSFSYRSFYDSVANHGDVLSYVLDNNNTSSLDDDTYVFNQSQGSWSANDQLSRAINNGVSARQIITQGEDGPVAFTEDTAGALKESQRTDLLANFNPNSFGASDEEYLNAAINYIRGIDNDDLGFRSRANSDGENNSVGYNLLGPILNSPALYIDGSADGYPDGIEDKPYSTYATTKAALYDGNELIFAGANDGMLHAFRANSVGASNNFGEAGGDEIFAYIPSPDLLANELNETMATGFTNKAYVDGAMVSADVYVENDWATYLLGALGTGGQGIYALDISNPANLQTAESNPESILKWEFTHPQLGYTFGWCK